MLFLASPNCLPAWIRTSSKPLMSCLGSAKSLTTNERSPAMNDDSTQSKVNVFLTSRNSSNSFNAICFSDNPSNLETSTGSFHHASDFQ